MVDIITISIKKENKRTVTTVPAEKLLDLSFTFYESINLILESLISGIVEPVPREPINLFTTLTISVLNKLKS